MRLALVTAGLLWLAFAGNAWGARAWLPPVPLTPPGSIGGDQEVQIAPDGTVVVTWVQQQYDPADHMVHGSQTMVLVKRPADLAPEPVVLERDDGGSARLAMNARGDAAVLWHDVAERRLEVARLKAGDDAFGPPEALEGPDQVTSNTMAVAMNGRGDIAVVDRDWRAYELGHGFFGWIAAAGKPFEYARLLGERTEPGLSWDEDVAVAPDGTATLLFTDSPHVNPEMGPTGPARIGAVTWRAGGGEAHEEWVHTVPQGRALGCARIGIDDAGRAAAQWIESTGDCYAPDHMETGPLQVAWRDAGEEDFGDPLDGARWVTQTQRGLSMSGGGEVLATYHPYSGSSYDPLGAVGRPDGRVALAAPFAPLLQTQAVAGEPRDGMLAANGRGLIVLAERLHSDTYFARLTVARREPGGTFGELEDVRPDCLSASIWTRGAIGAGGEAAVVSRNEATGGVDLSLDTEVPEAIPRPCALQPIELPPIDPSLPPDVPQPPDVPLPVGATPQRGATVLVGRARVTRRGRTRILTVPLRCTAACVVRGRGRFLAGRRVLARDRSRTTGRAARTTRLRLRFRARRRAVRRAKVAANLAVALRGAAPTAHRLVARAR